ncbi:MAG TPA: glutathione S-transferase [Alphaproteobacteria bacterium]|jgi:glutathione S-transferase|nr:glutathione S-transferase [Alphaproteobacteria bacterium]
MPKITVHHLNNSKSQRVLWLLEELGLDYEIKFYQRDPGFAPPEMKLIHPLGKAPIVEIDGVVMAESGAIVEFLVDRHGGGRLMPDRNSPSYGHYLEMMHYPEGSFSMPVVFPLFIGAFGVQSEAFGGYAQQQIALQLDYVSGLLKGREYLIDNQFTAADLQIAFILQTARGLGFLEGRQDLLNYIAKLEARPAHARAIERGGPFDLSFGRR